MAVAVAVFLIALALIASERVHRTKVALLGAALVVLFVSDFSQDDAIEAVDFNTIGLLAGMMILVYLTQQTGVYDYIAVRAGQLSGGRPLWVVLSLAGTTALLSAFLDNLTTILLVVPITFLLADALDIDPIPLIVIEVLSSNIGGTATLIGDPPNIIIAGATGLSFNEFITNLAPIVLVTFVVVISVLYLFYRPRLQIEEENRRYVMELDAAGSISDPVELRRTGPVLVATIITFFAHQALGIEPATVALTGAAVALLVTSIDLQQALSRIEWPTLFFFVAL
ncbi:MAG TPA: SLC13 family permease, partial [Solirubrobacterales bacterium]|nr:SLC13 family permease [Solirubrobacterales bacterium]